ncbi:MAG TPA: hypothetical protein DD979_01740 [Gammaproteobacteria bacterium]|jgi:uncharacterized membrane protein YGL010W|nr:hypothetical protein [Gammaproteobacteria bacterium]
MQTLSLALTHFVLLMFFIILTAFEGIFMIPVAGIAGIPITLFFHSATLWFKALVCLLAIGCIWLMWLGWRARDTMRGRALNVIGFYLWIGIGLLSLKVSL